MKAIHNIKRFATIYSQSKRKRLYKSILGLNYWLEVETDFGGI